MTNAPIKTYFQINEDNYGHLIDALMAEVAAHTQGTPDEELIAARRHFFEIAIIKGADLSNISERLSSLSAEKFAEAAEKIPDKSSIGWTGTTEITEEDRENFRKAAELRSPDMRWDGLFSDRGDDIRLAFTVAAKSSDDKIAVFLAKHNEQAAMKLAEAREKDAIEQQTSPQARPKAGRDIEQREIKLDPENHLKLQEFDPNKKKWVPGPRLNKYLQEQFEWELYDIVQIGADLKNNKSPESTFAGSEEVKNGLRDIADRSQKNIDYLLSSGELEILISRDPQKIGEMSTGQRWRSCMAKDGCNFKYVPQDIEAGSLVAYVVHKDDTQARWPLMRVLIKPFRNANGDTILVPANRVYGGEISASQTIDALKLTLNRFVAANNVGKIGDFHMDQRLYTDGQATVANLQGEWTRDLLGTALENFQTGAIQEFQAELVTNIGMMQYHRFGPHGEDLEKKIKELKGKMRRVLSPQDMENGLPRMFYRKMLGTSVGQNPNPKDVYEVSKEHPSFNARSGALYALLKGNRLEWEKNSELLSSDQKEEVARITLLLSERGSDAAHTAAGIWHGEIEKKSEFIRQGCYAAAERMAPADSELRLQAAGHLEGASERIRAAEFALNASPEGSTAYEAAADIIVKNLPGALDKGYRILAVKQNITSMPNPQLHDNVGSLVNHYAPCLAKDPFYKDMAEKYILENLHKIATPEEQIEGAKEYINSSSVGSPIYKNASDIIIQNSPKVLSEAEVIKAIGTELGTGTQLDTLYGGLQITRIPKDYWEDAGIGFALKTYANNPALQSKITDMISGVDNNWRRQDHTVNYLKQLDQTTVVPAFHQLISKLPEKLGLELIEHVFNYAGNIYVSNASFRQNLCEIIAKSPALYKGHLKVSNFLEKLEEKDINPALQHICSNLPSDQAGPFLEGIIKSSAYCKYELLIQAYNLSLSNIASLQKSDDRADKIGNLAAHYSYRDLPDEVYCGFERALSTLSVSERVSVCKKLMDPNKTYSRSTTKFFTGYALRQVPHLGQVNERVQILQLVMDHWSGEKDQRELAGQMILAEIPNLTTRSARRSAARQLFKATRFSSLTDNSTVPKSAQKIARSFSAMPATGAGLGKYASLKGIVGGAIGQNATEKFVISSVQHMWRGIARAVTKWHISSTVSHAQQTNSLPSNEVVQKPKSKRKVDYTKIKTSHVNSAESRTKTVVASPSSEHQVRKPLSHKGSQTCRRAHGL